MKKRWWVLGAAAVVVVFGSCNPAPAPPVQPVSPTITVTTTAVTPTITVRPTTTIVATTTAKVPAVSNPGLKLRDGSIIPACKRKWWC